MATQERLEFALRLWLISLSVKAHPWSEKIQHVSQNDRTLCPGDVEPSGKCLAIDLKRWPTIGYIWMRSTRAQNKILLRMASNQIPKGVGHFTDFSDTGEQNFRPC
jgi:hypothetical protein